MVHLNVFLAVEKDSKARMMCRFVHCFFFPWIYSSSISKTKVLTALVGAQTSHWGENTKQIFFLLNIQQYMWRKYNCFCTDQTLKLFLVSFKPWLKIKREPWGKVEYWLLIINLRLHRIGTKYTKKRLNLKRESSTLNISGNSCNFFFLKILRGGGGFLSRQKLKGEIIMFRVFFWTSSLFLYSQDACSKIRTFQLFWVNRGNQASYWGRKKAATRKVRLLFTLKKRKKHPVVLIWTHSFAWQPEE